MFRYNLNANYQSNGGLYLQILSGKDLYKQTIVISKNDTFSARFPNIFVDYPLGQVKVGDKLWTNWNKAPLKLWQTQLTVISMGGGVMPPYSFPQYLRNDLS